MTERRVPLKCPSNVWGHAIGATGTLEVRCRGKYCRTADGGTVMHRFDLADGSFDARAADSEAVERPKEQDHARNAAV